ncbi:hypothetical protein [Candidatus Chloroploca asiatica]|uniref:Uncharacterized protein n=1 Tax=Candidatus Chloroploca asiatica TaxID=1506545 RepID=A0A2H3KR46_9CHLR|nr:hypothetical protein [Candidatus Chloroploca asiatica]PDW00975.1 hypothetical protein A9Q02_21335 [Candidatus Chloroploca asiatica]
MPTNPDCTTQSPLLEAPHRLAVTIHLVGPQVEMLAKVAARHNELQERYHNPDSGTPPVYIDLESMAHVVLVIELEERCRRIEVALQKEQA